MKSSVPTSILLLLPYPTGAIPTSIQMRADPPNSPIHLQDGPDPSRSYPCGSETYTGFDIYLAVQYAVNLESIGETRGKHRYPHPFDHDNSKGNILHFPSSCPADGNRKEYPLKNGGSVYNGGKNNNKQGEERVVYYEEPGEIGGDGHSLVYYCGLMTHEGAPTGGFVLC